MQCPTCGAVCPDGATECPTCGAPLPGSRTPARGSGSGSGSRPAPASAKAATADHALAVRADDSVADDMPDLPDDAISGPVGGHRGLVAVLTAIALLLLGVVIAIGVVFVLPVYTARTPAVPIGSRTSRSGEPTATAAARDQLAAEAAVTAFYDAINTGDLGALPSMVTSDTTPSVGPAAFKGWQRTTFGVARSVLDTDTAYVYGRESRRALGGKDKGVKFILSRVGGTWLIKSWEAVDEGTVTGSIPKAGQKGVLALTEATARDVVSTLLQARQVGDGPTIRMLTTMKFQLANSATWLNGVDNSKSLTNFSITAAQKKGAVFRVTAREAWVSGVKTSTYSVIKQGDAILVDGWSTK